MIETHAPVAGGRLAVRMAGERGAPAILLIRPFAGSSGLWGEFGAALATRLHVITYDHRGTGGSSPLTGVPSTRTLARDAAAVLDHVGVASAHVYGVSLGGMVATWLAVDAPARVERHVLASALPRGTSAGVLHTWRGAARGVRLARCFARPRQEAARCLAREILSRRFREEEPAAVAAFEEELAAEPLTPRAALTLIAAAARHDARAALPSIHAPTLVLCGGLDPIITVDAERKLLAEVPDTTFDVIPRAGHAIDVEQPAACAARVLAFVG